MTPDLRGAHPFHYWQPRALWKPGQAALTFLHMDSGTGDWRRYPIRGAPVRLDEDSWYMPRFHDDGTVTMEKVGA